MEHFGGLSKIEINASTEPCPRHAVFNYFLSYDSKQDATIDTAHINLLIGFKKTDVSIKYNMGKY